MKRRKSLDLHERGRRSHLSSKRNVSITKVRKSLGEASTALLDHYASDISLTRSELIENFDVIRANANTHNHPLQPLFDSLHIVLYGSFDIRTGQVLLLNPPLNYLGALFLLTDDHR